jgi:hypothetical protein
MVMAAAGREVEEKTEFTIMLMKFLQIRRLPFKNCS